MSNSFGVEYRNHCRCFSMNLIIVLNSFAILVTTVSSSSYGPWITNSVYSAPSIYYPTRLIYEKRENVTLECHPPLGAEVLWGNVNISEGNYALPSTHVTYIKDEDVRPIQLTVYYNTSQWVSKVNVTCYSNAPWTNKSNYTTMIIEQKYPTSNVVINDGSAKVKAKPGEIVTLECRADGNPNSTYGSWYNKTSKATYRMAEYGKNISFPYLKGTNFQYACQARNFFRGVPDWMNSSWVEVGNSSVVIKSSFLFALLPILVSLLLRSP